MAQNTAGRMIARFGAICLAAGLITSTVTAKESDRKDPAGQVTILLPGDIAKLPPEPLPPIDPSLADPESVGMPAYQHPRYRRLATPEFETFENEVEFRRFMRSVARLNRNKRYRLGDAGPSDSPGTSEIVIAIMQDSEPECAVPEDCPGEADDETRITVTGSRVVASVQSVPMAVTAVTAGDAANITNTQVAAVDEGDIVKLIGEYLLVLQDGRIFAVHYPTMRLTDREDVYRKDEDGKPIGADWYDEMLVQGNQIIVSAYSYEDDASEITVLRLDQDTGQVEVRGVFLISSDDYYDVDNYATRIVGDKLVIHTPYRADDLVSRRQRPVIRRWTNPEDFYENENEGRQVLNAREIYRPVFGVRDPWIHSVSICPLTDVIDRGLECETTGFVGSEYAEMYVAADAVYLWNWALGPDEQSWTECEIGTESPGFGDVAPAAVYRVPIGRGEVEILGVRGLPLDQFSMDATATRFRALSQFERNACFDEDTPRAFALLNASQGQFRDRYVPAREREFVRLPSLMAGAVENRFVGDWIVYGGRGRYSRRPLRDEEGRSRALSNILHAVPIGSPEDAEVISIGHSLVRLERMGDSAFVANGYADQSGLRVSYVGLEDEGYTANIRSSAFLSGRYESESRSHAFNATYTFAGDGMMGVPTVSRVERSNGYWWYSDVSDLSFLSFSAQGLLADAGQIIATPEGDVKTGEGYDCEVSCIDWYGNARPIFLGGRVYGLMATELVEADVVDGRVMERRRVDLTGAIAANGQR